ncbi:hypothetical protein GGI07_000395 [Coemansia sp. Benny D115]|nr:hypothetical protein GGI07_000395 [Coemansia sp. Benny D115]
MHSINISALLLIASTAASAEMFFNVPIGLDRNAVKAAFLEHGIQGFDPAAKPNNNGLYPVGGANKAMQDAPVLPNADQRTQVSAHPNAGALQGPPPGKPVSVPLVPAHGPVVGGPLAAQMDRPKAPMGLQQSGSLAASLAASSTAASPAADHSSILTNTVVVLSTATRGQTQANTASPTAITAANPKTSAMDKAKAAASPVGAGTPGSPQGTQGLQGPGGINNAGPESGSDNEDEVVEEEEVVEDAEPQVNGPIPGAALPVSGGAAPVLPVASTPVSGVPAAASTVSGSSATVTASATAAAAAAATAPVAAAASAAGAAVPAAAPAPVTVPAVAASTTTAAAAVAVAATPASPSVANSSAEAAATGIVKSTAASAITSAVAKAASSTSIVALTPSVSGAVASNMPAIAISNAAVLTMASPATAVSQISTIASSRSSETAVALGVTPVAGATVVPAIAKVRVAAGMASEDSDDNSDSEDAEPVSLSESLLSSAVPASSSSGGGVTLKPLMLANRGSLSVFKPEDIDKFTFPSTHLSVNMAGMKKDGGEFHGTGVSGSGRVETAVHSGFQGSMPGDASEKAQKSGSKANSAKATESAAKSGATSAHPSSSSNKGESKERSGSGFDSAAGSVQPGLVFNLVAAAGAALFSALALTNLATLGLAASTVNLRVNRDATVSFNGILCNNDTVPCSSIPQGLQNKVTTFKGNRDYTRILLGFDLPTNAPTKCVLKVPKAIDVAATDGYQLTVTVTDDTWDEATVSGYTKRLDGTSVGSVNVTTSTGTGSLDVTDSCKKAKNLKLSFFLDTNSSLISFNSIQSGNPDVFTLDYTF